MKRVCTLRKVYRSLSKVLLEKLFLSFLYIVWLFMTTQFFLFLSYLQPGDMLWNGKVTLNICMRKVFLDFIITKNGSEAYFRFKKGYFELQKKAISNFKRALLDYG